MKYFITILLLICFSQFATAQNLVPNPSFEDTVTCPNGFSQPYYAHFWNRAKGSPDYFNSCYNGNINNGNVSVPHNSFGFQNAATGDAYAGFLSHLSYNPFNPNEREWLKCSLISPLTIGKKYSISFEISLADSANCASNNIGILFSTVSLYYNVYDPLNNFTHFNYPYIITDTANWTTIHGSFIADSAYKYMLIGNFYDYSLTDSIFYPNRPLMLHLDSTKCVAYYYIDNISVEIDTTNEIHNNEILKNQIDIYPNPASEKIIIDFRIYEEVNIKIFNTLGQLLFDNNFIEKSIILNLSDFNNGAYLLQIKQKNKTFNKVFTLNKI